MFARFTLEYRCGGRCGWRFLVARIVRTQIADNQRFYRGKAVRRLYNPAA
jgi:hypothetical protein